MSDPYNVGVRTSRGGFLLNCLTIGIVLTAFAAGLITLVVFFNPYVPFNPYPPPTLPATFGAPTITPTPEIFLPPTWTPLPAPTQTNTPEPSETPSPSATPESEGTDNGSTSSEPFVPQDGSPVLTPNIANDLECQWMGVGGQIFDINGEPIQGLGVHLEGTIDGTGVELDTLSGSSPSLGPAGYVFNLTDEPIATEDTLWVQLNDTAGVTLSDQVFFDTSASCDENFVLINWIQVR